MVVRPRQDHSGNPAACSPRVCEYCGSSIERGGGLYALVPDSSHLHPSDPSKDGKRISNACSGTHAQLLIDLGRQSWIDEQLWSVKLTRVSARWNRSDATISAIASLAGITPRQLHRALDWRNSENGNRSTRGD